MDSPINRLSSLGLELCSIYTTGQMVPYRVSKRVFIGSWTLIGLLLTFGSKANAFISKFILLDAKNQEYF